MGVDEMLATTEKTTNHCILPHLQEKKKIQHIKQLT